MSAGRRCKLTLSYLVTESKVPTERYVWYQLVPGIRLGISGYPDIRIQQYPDTVSVHYTAGRGPKKFDQTIH